jgi:hypothetical protein
VVLKFAVNHDRITMAEAVERYARVIKRHVKRTCGRVTF